MNTNPQQYLFIWFCKLAIFFDIRKETEGKAAKMGEHQQFDNSSDANAIKNIFQCVFKQRSSFFHQGNGVSTLEY